MAEKVKVQSRNGVQEMEITALPEGTTLEYYAAKQFLEIYNRDQGHSYEIDLMQDSPDVACKPQLFFIKIATVFDKPTNAPIRLV